MSLEPQLIQIIDEVVADFIITSIGKVKCDKSIDVVGLVSFNGLKIQGTIGIGFNKAILISSHPMGSEGVLNHQQLSDWASEVTNQVVGRFKNRLSLYGADFNMATPTTIVGNQLTIGKPDDSKHFAKWIGSAANLFVYAMMKYDEDLRFDKTLDEPTSLTEGDTLIF